MTQAATPWRLPVECTHHLAGSAGSLTFVGGAGDFDSDGVIRNPGDLVRQIAGAMSNVDAALRTEGCALEDAVRIKAYYLSDGNVDEWEVLATIANLLPAQPLAVISVLPVALQPFDGQSVQIQAIAQRGWRASGDFRVATSHIPVSRRALFTAANLTAGLRAGEFIAVANRTAADDDGAIDPSQDGIEQTRVAMSSMESTLAELGASFQDAVKKEGYYFGTTREHWAGMAKCRASFFREPGPVATVVPCHLLWPENALTKIEVLAMRCTRGGFDKYIPREDCWPERVWDWPIPLPYRQASRLRDTIWLGGQVPSVPFNNAPHRVLAGQLGAQTALTMSYIEDLLRGFDRRSADLKLAVCYFRCNGENETTEVFLKTLSECMGGALPPLTLVPQPHMHTAETTVEIWGVASS